MTNVSRTRSFLSLKMILLLSLGISVLFHLIFILSAFFGDTFFFPEIRHDPQRHFSFLRLLKFTAANFLLVFVLFLYNRRMYLVTFKKQWMRAFFIILGSLLITAAISMSFSLLNGYLSPREHDPDFMARFIRDGMVRDLSYMVVVELVTLLLWITYDRNTIAVENEALRAENVITHYEALKSQMDPHFMFNSLNTLQSLIDADPAKAHAYVQELSQVLRSTLQNKEVVTLEQELQGVYAYCNLMQIRYGDNLLFDFQIGSQYLIYQVLPLSIQGLVENSVKHNVISAKQPLVVSIVTTGDGRLKVANPIQPKMDGDKEGGIGLENLTERYRLKWNAEVTVADDGATFEVTLPLVKPQER